MNIGKTCRIYPVRRKPRSLFFSAGYKLPQDIFEVVPGKERQAVTTDEAWEEEYNQVLYQIK
ncbi:hypothetical protein [Photorhabdus asymbiotica]|uniref:hypothetical protein n=1 Tax=Photorhabdus asymbiotica TaxID=291112 RepID=UPI003DA745C9